MPAPTAPVVSSVPEAAELVSHRQAARAAVLLVNLGTPDAPETGPVRRYLREFLSDRRVVEVPQPLWWLILNGIICPFRAPRSARAYARIWTENGSPLLLHTQALAHGLKRRLAKDLPRVEVLTAMTYGQPSIPEALARLRDENIQRLLVLPLFPQYSATTTAAVFDGLARALKAVRWLPELRLINDYHHDPKWVEAIAASIRRFQATNGTPDRLLMSFHGIPKRNLLAGDPYFCQCHASARRIASALALDEDSWAISFQSRLGRAEWLKPYTDQTLEQWARDGVGRVQVVCPGFSVDCLETLEEIAMENREEFIAAGGQSLDYIPALNDSAEHAALLEQLCRRHGQGWPEFEGRRDAGEQALAERAERVARQAGALGLPD